MATILPHRPTTNGIVRDPTNALNRQTSLSSFPSSRTPSNNSVQNGLPRSIQNRAQRNGSNSSSRSAASPFSATIAANGASSTKNIRRLKPQYPADSPERHVEYILVASFDIDRGPIMEHQYPGAISGNENMLAELMLPDQAHVRNQDWTIFFLHKDNGDQEESLAEQVPGKRVRRGGRADADSDTDEEDGGEEEHPVSEEGSEEITNNKDEQDEEEEGGEGPPLIYVLNLVNTKQDNTVKR